MAIFPLAPDQTIAQMWSNGVRGGGVLVRPSTAVTDQRRRAIEALEARAPRQTKNFFFFAPGFVPRPPAVQHESQVCYHSQPPSPPVIFVTSFFASPPRMKLFR